MGKYTTKYFGDICINEDNDFEYIDLYYENNVIGVTLGDCNLYGNKLRICLEILDKYFEINEMTKKAIFENFPNDETVKNFFDRYFGGINKDIDNIKKIVGKFEYADLTFGIENDQINFSIDYLPSKEYLGGVKLCVKMDEKLNIINFFEEY
jgi:hypothetical protein